MKQQFRMVGFGAKNMEYLQKINGILESYQLQGYVLTLRQLYYQLVSKAIIPNAMSEYHKLSTVCTKARMGGMMDWHAIEDRIRVPQVPYYVTDIEDALQETINQYRLDRMSNQHVYIEVWIEKDALSGVFLPVTEKYHIRLMVNRGYSSISAMYKAANRFKFNSKENIILYFGDHDPSGLDMIRDIDDRLTELRAEVEVIPIALNMGQIKEDNPPPNPTKISDPRADWYIGNYGDESWELDALEPARLTSLVEQAIEDRIDLMLIKI